MNQSRFIYFAALIFLIWHMLNMTSIAQAQCVSHPVTIVGDSLSPRVLPGAVVSMIPVSCLQEPFARESLVVFRTGAHEKPLIKALKGLPGDRFAIVNDTIEVNGQKLRNSAGVAFRLTKNRTQMLALYARRFQGTIPPKTYLVMGDHADGTADSTRLGLIHRNDIIMVSAEP